MSFLIQYTCPHCGYKSPESNESEILIDPWDMPDLYICTCLDCKMMFHRKLPIKPNKCKLCGSSHIAKHKYLQPNPLYVCTCSDCEHVFEEHGIDIDKCIYCDSRNIVIHEQLTPMPCPECGNNMSLDCIGTAF